MSSEKSLRSKATVSIDQPFSDPPPHHHDASLFWGDIVKSTGLVFGDIGTSPIYTLTAVVAFTKPTTENIHEILSLIVWTSIVLVSVEYAWLAMSLGRKGEGGAIVLHEILMRMLKSGRKLTFVTSSSPKGSVPGSCH